jgi:hypothetical protein
VLEEIIIEVDRNSLRRRISNGPHRTDNATVPGSEHSSGEMDRLLGKFLVASTGLTGGEESQISILEVLLDNGGEVEGSTMEEEFAAERVLRVLRSMASEMDAAEALQVVEALLRADLISFEL